MSRKEDFKRIYGRNPTDEELKVFEEYISLIKNEPCNSHVSLAASDKRRILFEQKTKELLEFLIEKDSRYAGKEPLGNIKDNARTFNISPLKFCLLRINEKWNRVRHNIENLTIIKEELRDIWGYALLGLLLIDEENLQKWGE